MKNYADAAQIAYSYWLQNSDRADLTSADKKILSQYGVVDSNIHPVPATEGDLLVAISESYNSSLEQTKSKKNGIVYTPPWLASHIVSTALNQWKTIHRGGRPPRHVADVSCGTGIFLAELHRQLRQVDWACTLHGMDNDKNALKVAQLYAWAANADFELTETDTLTLGTDLFSNQTPGRQFDVIVGNPPYVRSSSLDKEYVGYLRSNYRSAQRGAFDLAVLFVEKTLALLADGGIASLVLTNKFMTSAYGKELCRMLAEKYRVVLIEDFHDIQLFPGFTTYTCILTVAKLKPAKRFTLRKHFDPVDQENPKLTGYKSETLPSEVLKSHPWNLASGTENEIIRKFSGEKNPLLVGTFACAFQGIRTGANDIFIVPADEKSSFEDEYLMPFISAENIGGVDVPCVDKYVIYPYRVNDGIVERVSEEELMERAPKLHQYLVEHKAVLESRSLQSGASWYEFSRGQNLQAIARKKVLIKEMMPTADFSVDLAGEFAFAAGYALDGTGIADEHIVAWASILRTPTMEFMLRHHGTQLHSGWFRLMAQHLGRVRLPNLSPEDLHRAHKITKDRRYREATKLKKLDDLVAVAFDLNSSERAYIEEYLGSAHLRSMPKKEQKTPKAEAIDKYEPVKLLHYNKLHVDREDLRRLVTFAPNKGAPIHGWYKYTQGFSADLVSTLLDEFDVGKKDRVLDPFNGCGTTTTVSAYRGCTSVGIEISPLMCKVAEIKARKWNVENIRQFGRDFSAKMLTNTQPRSEGFVFADYIGKAYASNISSQLSRIMQFVVELEDDELRDICSICFLSILEDVSLIRKHGSHYRFLNKSSSVGLQKLNISVVSENENVYEIFKLKLVDMIHDILGVGGNPRGKITIRCRDARKTGLGKESVDFVVTSPPYLNRNNYISQQKAELDFLGLVTSKDEYKALVKSTFRSHTDSDLSNSISSTIDEVQLIVDSITLEDGNNPKIPHMICGYFDDLYDTLKELFRVSRKGATIAFVVGNTRWGGIVVPVDHLLLMLAEQIGFSPEKIMVTRLKGNSPQQMRRYGRIPVRESIVVFRKPQSSA